jgi:hypothetical protein
MTVSNFGAINLQIERDDVSVPVWYSSPIWIAVVLYYTSLSNGGGRCG